MWWGYLPEPFMIEEKATCIWTAKNPPLDSPETEVSWMFTFSDERVWQCVTETEKHRTNASSTKDALVTYIAPEERKKKIDLERRVGS